jgi:hypothetical protein
MRVTKASAYLCGFYVALLVWWATIALSKITDSPFNLAFAFAYGLMPLFGGILGFLAARKWGLLKSAMGKALLFFSLGLIMWGLGEMIWSYYNFVERIEIPYPSIADIFFVLSWPLWGVGVWYMSYATGAKYGLKSKIGKIQLFSIPIVAALFSYYLLVMVARGGTFDISGDWMKIFFDIAYPLFDVIVLAIGALVFGLSFKFLGGKYKWPVIITLFGFIINYFADFGFSYTTTVGSFYNGNWVDLLFTSAMFVISFGVNSFDAKEG